MIRAALFLVLVFATHASLALLFTFKLRAVLAQRFRLFRRHAADPLPAVPSAQPVAGQQSLPGGMQWLPLRGPDLRRWPHAVPNAAAARYPAREERPRHFLRHRTAVEESPEIVRRAQARAEGHLIATHTWSHPSLFCFLSPARLRAEIHQGMEAVRRVCGIRPRYFRSPVGLRHPLLRPYLDAEGSRVHLLEHPLARYAGAQTGTRPTDACSAMSVRAISSCFTTRPAKARGSCSMCCLA